jgi:hypothetical protein
MKWIAFLALKPVLIFGRELERRETKEKEFNYLFLEEEGYQNVFAKFVHCIMMD